MRVSLQTADAAVRCRAAIPCCRFELRPGKDGRSDYRPGGKFSGDGNEIKSFCVENADSAG